ncbi:hypothetical protein KIN20_010525 [Parelaphostrongylus tenuis]|uniref:Uncharacterized protein n=1 Tax=Parelaphostrongylus tenuis TaxID=148309 RepID=A0AAD5MCM6_PARTN|nr:hypothetical protein KIN20_010518 [Parelaphostrongylus tenuis]KAJ1353785.1 hypothetical protein KIN20_010525 [Parelaphostrongylus tenuis]
MSVFLQPRVVSSSMIPKSGGGYSPIQRAVMSVPSSSRDDSHSSTTSSVLEMVTTRRPPSIFIIVLLHFRLSQIGMKTVVVNQPVVSNRIASLETRLNDSASPEVVAFQHSERIVCR